MACNSVKASAPGSIMLFGEHAILAGFKAIAMAINQRMSVTISLRNDNLIKINSDTLGDYATDLTTLSTVKPFQFVLQTLLFYKSQLNHGLDITITSPMDHTKGFGTSAAVTVACVAALEYLLNEQQDKHVIFLNSREIIQQVQGRGSGTDALASTMGGIVSYVMEPLDYHVYPVNLPVSLIYCGYKTPTPEVIKVVEALKQREPERVVGIFREMNRICGEVEGLLHQLGEASLAPTNILSRIGALMNEHHQYQKQLGVSDDTIESIITEYQKNNVYGAKISGSGLGDCVVVLGDINDMNPILVETDLLGVTIDAS